MSKTVGNYFLARKHLRNMKEPTQERDPTPGKYYVCNLCQDHSNGRFIHYEVVVSSSHNLIL
jgi:hypothetical protein